MSTGEKTYPDPIVNSETARFWAAAKEGRLLLKHCQDCGGAHYYPRAMCPRCLSGNTEWRAASGRGTIYSYSVLRRAPVPYVVAYVTLAEGVTMLTNIVECDFDALKIGLPVEVVFRTSPGGASVPVFRCLTSMENRT